MSRLTRAEQEEMKRIIEENDGEYAIDFSGFYKRHYQRLAVVYLFIAALLAFAVPATTYWLLSQYQHDFLNSAMMGSTYETKCLLVLGLSSAGVMLAYYLYYQFHIKETLEVLSTGKGFIHTVKNTGVWYFLYKVVLDLAVSLWDGLEKVSVMTNANFSVAPLYGLFEKSNPDVFFFVVGIILPAVVGLVFCILHKICMENRLGVLGIALHGTGMMLLSVVMGGSVILFVPSIIASVRYTHKTKKIAYSIAYWVGISMYCAANMVFGQFGFSSVLIWYVLLSVLGWLSGIVGGIFHNPCYDYQ